MLLHKLLDPEETARRRKLRAHIVRRNRIRREIEQGLEPKWRRIPKPRERTANDYGWNPLQDGTAAAAEQNHVSRDGSALAFLVSAVTPTGPHDVVHRVRSPALIEGIDNVAPRFAAKQPAAEKPVESPTLASAQTAATAPGRVVGPASSLKFTTTSVPTQPTNEPVRTRWRDVLALILIQRHEEILKKGPKRVWRQERLGLLLFNRKRYRDAIDHLVEAIKLGCSSSICWRRLAQSHWYSYATTQDWDALWDAKAAFEQALSHLDMACNPYVLYEYARVLEALGSYDSALNACASLMTTFPRFALGAQVKLRFVLLQRYQLLTYGNEIDGRDKERTLAKCIEITKLLLLDKAIESHLTLVLYLHSRTNELLYEVASKHGDGPGTVARSARMSADQAIEQLFKVALALKLVTMVPGRSWRTWWLQSDTFTQWADHFQQQCENIAAADALARALDLMEAANTATVAPGRLPLKTNGPQPMTTGRKIQLYLAMALNNYESNQMERAIRAMETIFQLNPYLETVRQSLSAWFPAKWRGHLELEDASQIQIARVLRGLWGRRVARRRRQEIERSVEATYRANPYHPHHRRNVGRWLKAKYAPLFAAQDLAARLIQKAARTYLSYARIRRALDEQRAKEIQSLRAKHATKKYRYNKHVRFLLAQAVPGEFYHRFRREDTASVTLQRWFRGERVRQEYRAMVADKKARIALENSAASRIQRVFRGYQDQSKELARLSAQQRILEAQRRIQLARRKLARLLQRLYHAWRNRLALMARQQLLTVQQNKTEAVRRKSVGRIQRTWRRYEARKRGDTSATGASLLLEQLKRGHERVVAEENALLQAELDREASARKIQALYRGKRIRASLGNITRQVIPSASIELDDLLDQEPQVDGKPTYVVVHRLETVREKRALFDYRVVIVRPGDSRDELPLPHLLSAVQHSTTLHTLILDGGSYKSPRIELLFQALQASKTLRILGIGRIITTAILWTQPAVPEDESMDRESPSSALVDSSSGQRLTSILALSSTLRTKNFLLEQLHMHSNDLLVGDRNGAVLATIIGDYFYGRYGKLTRLTAQRMALSDSAAVLLGDALSINTVLVHLNLSGNTIRDDAATAIAITGLRANHSLVYLNVADNSIGSAGANALFSILKTVNRTLKTLVLSNNVIMNDAVASVFSALQANAVIEWIDLRGNLIHKDHLEHLDQAMRERTATTNEDLRLFLARRRFSGNADRGQVLSPIKKAKCHSIQPLSPHKWIKLNARTSLPSNALIQRPSGAWPVPMAAVQSPAKKRCKPEHKTTLETKPHSVMRLPALTSPSRPSA